MRLQDCFAEPAAGLRIALTSYHVAGELDRGSRAERIASNSNIKPRF
jgi:hypothetical protein